MKLLGVQLRKPSFNEITAAAIMAAGLWLAYVALLRATGGAFEPIEAGAALLVIYWGCVCVHLGIHVGRGMRHLALNVMMGGALLAIYQLGALLLA